MKINKELLEKLQMVSPGTLLRKGIDDILMANNGALIVFVDELQNFENMIQGGFDIDTVFTPEKLYELAKMDGAIVLKNDVSRILKANAHIITDPSIPTQETGTRHRTAERFAQQTNGTAIAISRRRKVITLYYKNMRYMINDVNFVITKVNQGLRALEKYKEALDKLLFELDVLELEDKVTLYDICRIFEKALKEYQIKTELEWFITELGVEGRLAKIQLEEMTSELEDLIHFLILDYLSEDLDIDDAKEIEAKMFNMDDKDLMNYSQIAKVLGYDVSPSTISDIVVHPKGFRVLNRIPRIPSSIVMNVVKTFKSLQGISHAKLDDLKNVEGIGEKRALAIIDGIGKIKRRTSQDDK
ncbi:MAG: diadenylate cyclase [Thermotogaceae bacterium]|jgi:diadenylate cyclase|nr:diadenylate cyclase [Thermotogaceae bacterium]MDN5337087.1 diadenylate cyclase [Thermotogaceae bacterium]